jgi:hypothetical protein
MRAACTSQMLRDCKRANDRLGAESRGLKVAVFDAAAAPIWSFTRQPTMRCPPAGCR